MDILALDLGTKTGYAYNRAGAFFCGTWELATDREIRQWGRERITRTQDPRVARLCEKLDDGRFFDIIVFEDVQFSTYTLQTQLWAALRSSIWLCANAGHVDCVPVKTLKMFAGHGNADKNAMSCFLKTKHPEIWKPTLDDNAIDAAWMWIWARHTFARMKIGK